MEVVTCLAEVDNGTALVLSGDGEQVRGMTCLAQCHAEPAAVAFQQKNVSSCALESVGCAVSPVFRLV